MVALFIYAKFFVPATYKLPQNFDLSIVSTTDISFDFTYTPNEIGRGYYIVLPSSAPQPTSTQVHNANVSGIIDSGSFDLLNTNPINVTVSSGIYGNYDYTVYAIHKSTDNFISETVKSASLTTPDTLNPVFLGDSSSPAFQSGGINPFNSVTFNFTEPVFYQGGDITFSGFSTGRVITINNAADISMSGTTITVNNHGTFAQDDFIIVTWADGTFKDNSGKNVAALTGFSHYFHTRLFTSAEAAFLMQGTYTYTTTFYGGLQGFYNFLNATYPNTFIPTTGQVDLMLDPSDPTGVTLLGINLFSGFASLGLPDEPQTLQIKFGQNGIFGSIGALVDAPRVPSVITSAGQPTAWGSWNSAVTGVPGSPGLYNVDSGQITHWMSLYNVTTGALVDDIDYNYTRIGTYARNSSSANNLISRVQELKDAHLNGRVRVLPTNVDLSF